MSTTGEPTPIYATRGKGGLPGRSGSDAWGRRVCIVSQAKTADGIDPYDGESSREELFTIVSIQSFAIERDERNTAQRLAITRFTSESAQESVRIVFGVRKQRRRKQAKRLRGKVDAGRNHSTGGA